MAFWFSLVLLALPLSVGSDEPGQDSVGPIRPACSRPVTLWATLPASANAGLDVCETGKSAMHTITARAEGPPRSRLAMLDDKSAGPDTSTMTGTVPKIVLPETVNLPIKN